MIGDIKHVFNRGINKNNIFTDDSDRKRFVESLYKFNNKSGAVRSEAVNFLDNPPPQDKIVEILKWAIMPNHFHLLLQEKVDGGISEFINRLGNGYTKYFNIRHKRSGFLFQNRTKMVLMENNRQFLYIPYYIDLNALDVDFPGWKQTNPARQPTTLTGVPIGKAIKSLENYRWSSFPDYFSNQERNFSKVINKELFNELFDTDEKHYKKELIDFIKNPVAKFKPD